MTLKYVRLQQVQIETVKDLLFKEIKLDNQQDTQAAEEYREGLRQIYDCLGHTASDLEVLANEIHKLKNEVQALRIERELITRRGAK